ncbi:MAG TPA: carbohydrate ABC transporter permease [Clostridia bacterium]|nr:carbohydrate ABC transporter permease [Clostridia bacterium]
MRIRKKPDEIVFDVCNHLFLLFWAAIALYPLLYVLFGSLSDAGRLASHRGLLFYPLGVDFSAYKAVMSNPLILSGYRNTLFVVIGGTALNLLMTALAAFFLSRKDVMWKNAVMIMLTITMYFGGGLIPSYIVVTSLGMRNSLLALIVPSAVNAFNVIVMRTSFQSIPDSMEEAALLDGATQLDLLFRVILPLSKAILAVMALWYGVGHWNSWFSAAIYLSKRELWPIQLLVREILIARQTQAMTTDAAYGSEMQVAETIKYATIIIATVPILCVYPFLQKHFVKGVMIGSLKG